MEFKNKTCYNLVPSEEEHYNTQLKEPIKEYPPIYNEDVLEKEIENKNKKKKEKKGNKKKLRQRKTFCVCFSNVQIGSRLLSDDESEEEKKELEDDPFKVAVKDGFLFSKVEIEPEEESEKVKELVERMNKKSSFVVCFSGFQVAH